MSSHLPSILTPQGKAKNSAKLHLRSIQLKVKCKVTLYISPKMESTSIQYELYRHDCVYSRHSPLNYSAPNRLALLLLHVPKVIRGLIFI